VSLRKSLEFVKRRVTWFGRTNKVKDYIMSFGNNNRYRFDEFEKPFLGCDSTAGKQSVRWGDASVLSLKEIRLSQGRSPRFNQPRAVQMELLWQFSAVDEGQRTGCDSARLPLVPFFHQSDSLSPPSWLR
jgi:hypothetical protein